MALTLAANTASAQAIYNSIPTPLPGNLLSVGFQADRIREIGDGTVFSTGSNRSLTTVKVTFSSFACTSGQWFNPVGSGNECITNPPGATFSQSITLNIYAVNADNSPGTKLATTAQSFSIPYRPSSDAAHCGLSGTPGSDGESWYSAADNACYHAIAAVETFDLSSLHLTLPDRAIITVTYNTTSAGYAPVGTGVACFSSSAGCPYDFLNVSTEGSALVGSNIDTNGVYINWIDAANSCSGGLSGSVQLDSGCWTGQHPAIEVDAQSPVNAVSVSPNTGSGLGPQTFNALYTDVAGASDLQAVYLDFSGTSAGATNSCFVAYVQSSNSLYLFNDSNSGILGPITPGSSVSVSNSQCTLSGIGGLVSKTGPNMTVPFNVTFKSTFGGPKTIYGLAQSFSGSQGNGWQVLGSWTPIPGGVNTVSVSPSSGAGVSQTFSALYTDSNGAADLQAVYFDVGGQGTPHSCFAVYVQFSNSLYLFNDTNSAILGPITPGSASTVSNGQCTLSGAGGPVMSSGNNLTVPFALTFAPAYTGGKNVYGLAQTYNGTQSPWVLLGTWTPASPQPLSAVSVTPVNGSGLGPFTFNAVYTDPNGASDLQVVYLDFGTAIFGPNSCIVAYVQSGNQLYLFNDAGNGVVAGSPITAGTASTLSNSQCTLSGGGGLATLAGNNLTAPFALTFTAGFAGSKNVWGLAQTYSGTQSPWALLGTWNP